MSETEHQEAEKIIFQIPAPHGINPAFDPSAPSSSRSPGSVSRAHEINPAFDPSAPSDSSDKDVPIIALRPINVTLTRQDCKDKRNAVQQDRLPKLIQDERPPAFSIPLERKYVCYKIEKPEEPQDYWPFQPYLYLFNIIVALEWLPGQRVIRKLEAAFRRASNFLYNVTDGYMAYGQVVVGGPELMDCADIQILASNRLNPRSWVGGLNDAEKYMPIRVGRGIWHKNNRVSIGWEEPEAYRTLVHEWGHYALNLWDEYLETRTVSLSEAALTREQIPPPASQPLSTLRLPMISIAREAIMATLEGVSELVPSRYGGLRRQNSIQWRVINWHYEHVSPDHPDLRGPVDQPLPVPVFRYAKLPATHEDTTLHLSAESSQVFQADDDPFLSDLPTGIQLEHCWVYLLRGDLMKPQQIIAQGSFDARTSDEGFCLLGAQEGDKVVLIGDDIHYQPVVLCGNITKQRVADSSDNPRSQQARKRSDSPPPPAHRRDSPDDPRSQQARKDQSKFCSVDAWKPVRPAQFPLIDVIPEPLSRANGDDETDPRIAHIRVRVSQVNDAALPEDVWVFPSGHTSKCIVADDEQASEGNTRTWIFPIAALDGHVLARYSDNTFVICTYSQGGGPSSNTPGGPPPISAGSSEGNVMLFFEDKERIRDYSTTRVVTTLLHGITDGNSDGAKPRGYTFSLCSNQPLPIQLSPTLIMNYDKDALSEGGRLQIYRYNPKRASESPWECIPTHSPTGTSFVAAPLTTSSAPSLVEFNVEFNAETRVERYRLFWKPDTGAGKSGAYEAQIGVTTLEEGTGRSPLQKQLQ